TAGYHSRFYAPSWAPGQLAPFIRTADDADGRAYVGDLYLILPNTTYSNSFIEGIEWQTRRASVENQLAVGLDWVADNFSSAPAHLVEVKNHGGGRWFGLQLSQPNTGVPYGNDGVRYVYVEGTTAPLTIYGSNPEHAGIPMYEFKDASNVRVL